MATTPNLGLTTWPNLDDFFSHTALAANFDKLDIHDHTPGKGVPVPTDGLANGAVTLTKLASTVFGNSTGTVAAGDDVRFGKTFSRPGLPSSPVNGQEVYYDVGDQRRWHLRYNSAGGTYPWEFLGGTALYAVNPTSYFFSTAANTWNSVGIGSQKLTLAPPRAGRYRVQWGGVLRVNATTAGGFDEVNTRLTSDGGTSGTSTPQTAVSFDTRNGIDYQYTVNGLWEGVVDTAGMYFAMRTQQGAAAIAASVVYISFLPIAIQ